MYIECKICHKEYDGQRGISSHLKQKHGFNKLEDYKQYYDQYILNEDLLCPVCKKNHKKFISFRSGYSITCLDEIDENGKPYSCRAIWANRDKEKASKSAIKMIETLKNTPDPENPSQTLFSKKLNKWYETMSQKDENGETVFDKNGPKIYEHHLTIDPNTGKSFATSYSIKAAQSNRNTIMPDGRTKHQHISQKSADTVSTTIMFDGRTQKEHMTDKAMDTRTNTILPNGLSILQETARKAYETKVKNGTLPIYHGYSKISKQIFEQLIEKFHLNPIHCFYAENEKQFIDSKNQRVYRYDFVYQPEDYPVMIIEFQGNQYHVRENELELRKDDTNPHGQLLLEGYYQDQIKKQYIQENHPFCLYYEIWEDNIENDIQKIKYPYS